MHLIISTKIQIAIFCMDLSLSPLSPLLPSSLLSFLPHLLSTLYVPDALLCSGFS